MHPVRLITLRPVLFLYGDLLIKGQRSSNFDPGDVNPSAHAGDLDNKRDASLKIKNKM